MDPHHRVILATSAGALLLGALANPALAQDGAGDDGPSLTIGVGAGVSQRELYIEGESPTFEGQNAGIYVGATIDAALWAPRSKSGTQLGVAFEGRYGVARDDIRLDELGGRQPIAEHYFGALRLALARRLAPSTTLELSAGLQATSFLVEQNSIYTGHRYISGLAGAELTQRFRDDLFFVSAGAFALPGIDTNESNQDLPADAFGARLRLGTGVTFLVDPSKHGSRKAGVELHYDFQRFRGQYPETTRFGPLGGASNDNQHLVTLSLHYAL